MGYNERMWLIPETWIIFSFSLAGVSYIIYTLTRKRRKARALLGWLAVPCFTISFLYLWFLYADIPIEERVAPTRLAFLFLGLLTSIIMNIAAYMSYYNHHDR